VRCAAALLPALLACGDGEDPSNGVCDPTPAQAGPIASSAARAGFVLVQDSWDRRQDDTGVRKDVRTGRVQAGFVDLSTVTSTPAAVMPLGDVCFGLVSRPVSSGRATPVPVTEVRVEGTARGTIRASRAGPGSYVAAGDPILGAGEGTLRFVVSATAAPGFDGVDLELPSLLGSVELSAPDPNAPPALTTDPYPVRWTPAGADWVEIQISPERDEVDDGGQVICRVADVGCFDIPVAATAFLLSGNADHYGLSVELHRYRGVEPVAGHLVEVEAVAQTELTIDNGVFE